MGREGFGHLGAEAFASYATELETGAWKGVKPARHATADAPVLAWLKREMVSSVEGVVAAQGHTSSLDALDTDWDDTERRLVFAVGERTVSRTVATRQAAVRVQAALCPGGTTGMTQKDFDSEVDFGRNQVRVAASGSLATDVAALGLASYVKDIDRATEALAVGLGRSGDEPGTPRTPRSRRIAQAVRQCGATFNFAYECVGRLHDEITDGHERTALAGMIASFDAMLARAAANAPAEAPPPAAPVAATPPAKSS